MRELCTIALLLTQDHHTAEDLAQETWFIVIEKHRAQAIDSERDTFEEQEAMCTVSYCGVSRLR